MTEVRFLPPAAKFIKKLKDKKLKMLYQEAVDKIKRIIQLGKPKPEICQVCMGMIFITIKQIMNWHIQ